MPVPGAGKATIAETRAGAAASAAWRVLLLFGCCTLASVHDAMAARWTIVPTGSVTAGLTHTWSSDNQSTGDSGSISGGITFRGEGARLKLYGSLSATETLFFSHPDNNSFAPQAAVTAFLEAIENFAFLEAEASVGTSFLTPLGPQPANLATVSNNRYISQAYRVSPYLQGIAPGNLSYLLRFDNYWSVTSGYGGSSNSVPNAYSNTLTARVASGQSRSGWSAEYIRNFYGSGLQGADYTTEVARAIYAYQVDPQLSIAPRIGYERDRFPQSTSEGVVYGIGGSWRPIERTSVEGFWEHRFFGSSYSLNVNHRLPNAAMTASFTRGLTNTPQLFLLIPAGTTLATFLDAAFTTRIPDPIERARAVQQFLAQSGLPPTLASPLNFYAATLQLQQTEQVSLVLIGVRNSLSFTAFQSRSETVAGTGEEIPAALQFARDVTQTGLGSSYSYRLSGFTSLGATATVFRTVSNTADSAGERPKSNNFNANASITTQFSPKTSGSVGVAYFLFEPSGSNETRTWSASVFATITHTF